MKFDEFKHILSSERLQRYMDAVGGNKSRTMTLYRYNLHVAQEMWSVIGCFEVALRNAIDEQMAQRYGVDWLRDSVLPGGIFDTPKTAETQRIIKGVYKKLLQEGSYTHSHLLSHMDFGIWKYMFSAPQYSATGKILLRIFPNKPKSTLHLKIDNTFVFNELDKINMIRNRIAHHEPICFTPASVRPDLYYIKDKYTKILTLLHWMGIEPKGLLWGLDHVGDVCNKINRISISEISN